MIGLDIKVGKLFLHSIVSSHTQWSPPNVVGEVDIANEVLSLELVVSIACIQLGLVDRLVFLLFFIILRLGRVDIIRLVNIFLLLCLFDRNLTNKTNKCDELTILR